MVIVENLYYPTVISKRNTGNFSKWDFLILIGVNLGLHCPSQLFSDLWSISIVISWLLPNYMLNRRYCFQGLISHAMWSGTVPLSPKSMVKLMNATCAVLLVYVSSMLLSLSCSTFANFFTQGTVSVSGYRVNKSGMILTAVCCKGGISVYFSSAWNSWNASGIPGYALSSILCILTFSQSQKSVKEGEQLQWFSDHTVWDICW